ncbi:hypothetical protein [Victivallis vadensis]|uniref:hypothetical protein n=1 Tax=Victivallis vadensis TaxID=172901 RepID=UPI003CFD1AF0
MSKYFICHAGDNQIPQNFAEVTGVTGELYWCADDEYARSPEECVGREDAMPAYWGFPVNANDDNHEHGEKRSLRRIFIDLQSFTEIPESEFEYLCKLKDKINDATGAYQKAIEKYFE